VKKKFRIVSVLLTVVLLMSAFVTPVAAGRENGRGRGEERGRGRQSARQIQYLDAEVRVIDGQPVIKVETKEGYASYEFPWPDVAVALGDGEKIALERQGNHFMLPTSDGFEKISIEEFQVALVAGQIMLVTNVNPWWTIPVAVAIAALKKAGVAVTTATIKAATLLIVAGKRVSAATVNAVVWMKPKIRAFLILVGLYSLTQVFEQTIDWMTGLCVHPRCTARTPGGPWGDGLCTSCAARWGQFWGSTP